MEKLAKKLDEFRLRKFISAHRHQLCQNTVNQEKIAAFLNFDADQIAIIMDPPDNFRRCFKLYEYIEKTTEASRFLEALNETGNKHMIEFIESVLMDFPSKRGIWFNIPHEIDSFCGREDFLSQLHDKFQQSDNLMSEVTVLSQVKIVSGLGGIGKTQTARKYISQYFEFYNNFIWIDAETEISMTNSFFKLAEEIQIPIKTPDGKSREIQEIVKEIYNKICAGGKSNLIVFDNAEDYQSCRQFLPVSAHPKMKKPVILATSRNQEWISPTGKIQVLPLDKMTEDESLEFILKQLEIPESEIPEFCEGSKEFIELIGGLPLALQQAVAYVKQEKKANELFGRPYKLNDYVQEFKSGSAKLQKFPRAPDSPTAVFITWKITFNKIKKDPKGGIAIEIIELMSFLYADKIPVEFLLQLLPLPPPPQNLFQQQHEDLKSTESDLAEGLNLLEKFSMIKIPGNFVSIHRQVQFVILQNLKGSGRLINFIDNLIKKCLVILTNIKLAECSDVFLNLHQIVNNQFDFIPMNENFLLFMYEFGRVLYEASRYSESLDLCKKVYNKYLELLGENHEKTLAVQHQIALQLKELGKYEESLTLYKETLQQEEIHLGPDHPLTVTTKHNTAIVLRQQGKFGESLEIFQQALAQRIKIHGEDHPKTLSTQNEIALVHSDLGNSSKAFSLYELVEKKQTEILDPDHRDVLVTKHNKATVLLKMGKFKEASKIFKENYEKEIELLGENHLSTIHTLERIADTLTQEGKFTEALELYRKVCEIRKSDLGENHPDTINVKRRIVNIESKLRDKSCVIL